MLIYSQLIFLSFFLSFSLSLIFSFFIFRAHHHLTVMLNCHPLNRTREYDRRSTITLNTNILNIVPLDLLNNLVRKSRDLLKQHTINFNRRGSIAIVEREDEIEIFGFGRLGRRILGRSLGLVLGGGGARGLAHLGIFRAFKEAGIQVDLIGGTSMGAFIGGLLAREGLMNYPRILQLVGQFCDAMNSKWRQILDLTYPATSWFTGHGFNRALWKLFGFSGIEDFSVPFYAVTTDLTRSGLQIHRSGPAWKYIRASMSLSGLLPPVCDSRDGTLLVDGGYLANVPIELMKKGTLTELSELTVKDEQGDQRRRDALCASIIIAVDVGRASDRVPIFYGDSLNGWWVLIQKLTDYFVWRSNPPDKKSAKAKDTVKSSDKPADSMISNSNSKSAHPLPLTLDEIQFRLVYASSAGLLSRTLRRSHFQLASDLEAKNEIPYVTVTQGRAIDPDEHCTEPNSSSHQLPEVIYLRPNGVQNYGTLEFQKWKDIIKIGYDYGKSVIEDWKRNGLLERILEYQGHQPEDFNGKDRRISVSSISNNVMDDKSPQITRYRRSSI